MQIRTATSADLAAVVQIEAECFPAAEAATELSLARRLALYPNHFWVLMDGKQLVGFVNGMATDEPDLRDEMYDDAALHNENGAWQMIFGVDTIPLTVAAAVPPCCWNMSLPRRAVRAARGLC